MVAYAQVAVGFLLLFGGGEFLIRGSVSLAQRLAVSPLLVGATVVAFGTSAPELAVCVQAAWHGHAALALGSVIGSNIANVLLILGVAATISPVVWQPLGMRRDAVLLITASVLFVLLTGSRQTLAPIEGATMVAVLLGVTLLSYWYERQDPPLTLELLEREAERIGGEAPRAWLSLLITGIGLVGVIVGSHQLVEGSTEVALRWGISEATIGLTLVAVGTSLPELATSLIAAYRNHADLALGTVVGSCIFNLLGVAGSAALVAPLAAPAEVMELDLWLMLAILCLLAVVLRIRGRLGRRAGLLCLLLYTLWLGTKL